MVECQQSLQPNYSAFNDFSHQQVFSDITTQGFLQSESLFSTQNYPSHQSSLQIPHKETPRATSLTPRYVINKATRNDKNKIFLSYISDHKDKSYDSSIESDANPYKQSSPKLPAKRLLSKKPLTKSRSKVPQKLMKKINKEQRKQQRLRMSLAERNIKLNFGTGFLGFIQFLIKFNSLSCQSSKLSRYQEIFKYLQDNYKNLRSFQGWQEIWNHPMYGSQIRKLSILFFRKSFAYVYLKQSKIKKNYLDLYVSKINSFYYGAMKPSKFTSFNFRNFDQGYAE